MPMRHSQESHLCWGLGSSFQIGTGPRLLAVVSSPTIGRLLHPGSKWESTLPLPCQKRSRIILLKVRETLFGLTN